MNIGTDVDTVLDNSKGERMELESPSSELEKLSTGNSSDNDSVKEGKYEVIRDNKGEQQLMDTSIDSAASLDIGKENISDNFGESVKSDSTDDRNSTDSKEPAEKKLKKDRRVTDSFLLEKQGNEGNTRLNETIGGSRPGSAASSGKSGTPSKEMKGMCCQPFLLT